MPQQSDQRLERLRLRYLHRKAALERAGLMTQGVAEPTAPTRRTDGTLALQLPYIFNLIGGGLNRDKLLGDFSTVQVRVGPWDFPNAGDTIRLHWGALWTREFPASTDPGGTILTLAGVDIAGEPLTDRDHFTGEGTHAIWYEVLAASGGSDTSGTVDVIVKTARPGGEDPMPDTPINESLAPPIAAPDPVDEATPECVFTAPPWKNLAESDSLTFRIGGYAFPVPAGMQSITLGKDQLAVVSGKATPVTYEIIDSVGNRSKSAPYLLLDIWSEGPDLLERIELVDDRGEFIQGAIDSAMSGIRARVPRYQSPPVPEGVFVQFDGTDRNGNGNQLKVLGPITWKPSDYYLDFPVPNEYLQTVAGGFVRVNYFVDDNKKSYRRLYDVDALPETRLPAPLPLGQVGNELPIGTDPSKEIGILIPDSEWLIDFSRITLTMRGQGPGGAVVKQSTYNVGDGEGHQPYTFAWKAADLQPLLDHEATFSYTIRTLDAHGALLGIHESDEHTVLVREAGAPGDQLPPPIVHGVVDGKLDPTTNPLKITIPAGHGKPARSKVTTTVSGLTIETRTDVAFDDNEKLDIEFRDWTALNDGASATAWYAFDGDAPSKAANFIVDSEAGLPEPTIDIATDSAGGLIANGGSTVSTTVNLSGKAAADKQVEILDGVTPTGVATANASGTWVLQLISLTVAAHSFTAKALYGSRATSAKWALTVVAEIAPTITSAKDDANSPISNGGSTVSTTIILSGKAAAGQKVQILNGSTPMGESIADAAGDWTLKLTNLSVASHSFTAKALYGSGETSAKWNVTITQAIHEDFESAAIGEYLNEAMNLPGLTVTGYGPFGPDPLSIEQKNVNGYITNKCLVLRMPRARASRRNDVYLDLRQSHANAKISVFSESPAVVGITFLHHADVLEYTEFRGDGEGRIVSLQADASMPITRILLTVFDGSCYFDNVEFV